jgi:hypothetical protein
VDEKEQAMGFHIQNTNVLEGGIFSNYGNIQDAMKDF